MTDFNTPEITQDDKLWAALGYPIPLVALIVLFMDEKKARPFIKFHAVQALVIWVIITLISTVTLGICFPFVWLVTLWPAYDSYQGNLTELPVITDLIKKQNWV